MQIPDDKTAPMYIIYFDRDEGARENWNLFYTPSEIFTGADAFKRGVLRGRHIEKTTSLECVMLPIHPDSIDPKKDAAIDHPYVDEDEDEDNEDNDDGEV